MRKTGLWGWALAGVMLLGGGCGDDDDDDDTVAPDAGVDAAPGADAGGDAGADAAAPDGGEPDGGPTVPLEWTACDAPLECATLTVPLDYAAPDGPQIELSLIRLPAASPADREGSVLMNFGGPGGSGIELMGMSGAINIASWLPEVADRFDLVSFDPRGIGESAPIDCVDDDFMHQLHALDVVPDDDAEFEALFAWETDLALGCEARSADLVPHVDTESVARDMDRIRAALGEERANYYGLSYGSVLGATYATLFPDRVGAFVLDSVFPSPTNLVDSAESMVGTHVVEFDRFLEYGGLHGRYAFHGGEGTAAVRDAYDALLASVADATIPAGASELGETDLRLGVETLLNAGDWDGLDQALADAEGGDGSTLLAAADPPLAPGQHWTGGFEAGMTVRLLDDGCPADFDLGAARTFLERMAVLGPRVGGAGYGAALCATWGLARPSPKTPLDASASPRMLILQGENDPQTPIAGLPAFLDELGNDSYVVTWRGNGHMVAFRNACTAGAMSEFLLDPTRPPRNDTCSQ